MSRDLALHLICGFRVFRSRGSCPMRLQFRQVFFRPTAKALQRLDQRAPELGERVLYSRWHDRINLPLHEPVTLEAAQGLREHLLRDFADIALQLGITLGAAGEDLNGQRRPFVSDPIEDQARWAAGAENGISRRCFGHVCWYAGPPYSQLESNQPFRLYRPRSWPSLACLCKSRIARLPPRDCIPASTPVKLLVVGSGGREHALAWKLRQSPKVERVYCAPGNAGTAEIAENVPIAATDLSALARFAKESAVGLTVVGPDDVLAAGIVDVFQGENLRIFGPTQSAARLESSKIFAKQLMRNCGIPTARAGCFEERDDAIAFCDELGYPLVVKADGLALGKGVIIAESAEAARDAIDSMMSHGRFGAAGRRVVVEEFLRGSECSLHALIDGANYRMLASARDHKRARDGDRGPNTGGMGAISPADNWNSGLEEWFEREVMKPLLDGLQLNGVAFRGLLFPGLMLTADGPRVLEFNCRFGDPETQAILPRLKSDLVELVEATIDGKLNAAQIEWDERVAVTVVMASGGYPEKYETGKVITGLGACARLSDVHVFHAGTRRENGAVVTAGGRVLAITALAKDVNAARARAYEAVGMIHFEGCHYRRDIALGGVTIKVEGH